MKPICFLICMAVGRMLCAQTSTQNGADEIIGSATIVHKPVGSAFDRWEISFHNSNYQKLILWLLVKSDRNELPATPHFRVKKKPFEKMGRSDLLGVVYLRDKSYPVKKGKVSLVIRDSSLKLEANLKVKGMGVKRYQYEGKYKIVKSR